MIQLQIQECEGELPVTRDWILESISLEFSDPDARRGPHFSPYISKMEAMELAAIAIGLGADSAAVCDVRDDFCDEEYIYGDARHLIWSIINDEMRWMAEFFYGP